MYSVCSVVKYIRNQNTLLYQLKESIYHFKHYCYLHPLFMPKSFS